LYQMTAAERNDWFGASDTRPGQAAGPDG
jgi:hypothetical protein